MPVSVVHFRVRSLRNRRIYFALRQTAYGASAPINGVARGVRPLEERYALADRRALSPVPGDPDAFVLTETGEQFERVNEGDPMPRGRGAEEWFWIAVMLIATAVMIGLTVWSWIGR